MRKQGFTLIELLISLTIIGILTGIGIVSYNDFNQRQTLKATALTLENNLRQAQNKAVAGGKPVSCSCLSGYQVEIEPSSYSISAFCDFMSPATCGPASSFTVPNGVNLSASSSPIKFSVIKDGANPSIITVSGFGKPSLAVNVSAAGEIYENLLSLVPTSPPSLTPTPTVFVPSPTLRPANTPTPSPTPSPTLRPTATPTRSPTPSSTPSPTLWPTNTPTPSIGCWVRANGTVPDLAGFLQNGRQGGIQAAYFPMYSGSSCTGNIVGYGNCFWNNVCLCSTNGTGICMEPFNPVNGSWKSYRENTSAYNENAPCGNWTASCNDACLFSNYNSLHWVNPCPI